MKRVLLAIMAATFALAPAGSAAIRGYQFAPAYRPETPRRPEAEVWSYDGIHKVAVISAIGTRFDLQLRGPLDSRSGSLDISAWQIDDRAEAIVRKALAGTFDLTRASCDRTALAALRADSAHEEAFKAFLRTIPANGADAFVVLRPERAGGLALQSTLYGDTMLWVSFELDVVDARSFETIARATARVASAGAAPPNFPGLVVGREFQLDRSLSLGPEKQEKLRILTGDMLRETVAATMAALRLSSH